LYTMYHRLSMRRGPQIAGVAVARERIGYLWAVMREFERRLHQHGIGRVQQGVQRIAKRRPNALT